MQHNTDVKSDSDLSASSSTSNYSRCFRKRESLTLLGSTAVRLGASVGRSLGILCQVILSRPVKDVAPVLRETTDSLIFESTHMVWNVCVCVCVCVCVEKNNKRNKHK